MSGNLAYKQSEPAATSPGLRVVPTDEVKESEVSRKTKFKMNPWVLFFGATYMIVKGYYRPGIIYLFLPVAIDAVYMTVFGQEPSRGIFIGYNVGLSLGWAAISSKYHASGRTQEKNTKRNIAVLVAALIGFVIADNFVTSFIPAFKSGFNRARGATVDLGTKAQAADREVYTTGKIYAMASNMAKQQFPGVAAGDFKVTSIEVMRDVYLKGGVQRFLVLKINMVNTHTGQTADPSFYGTVTDKELHDNGGLGTIACRVGDSVCQENAVEQFDQKISPYIQ